MAANKKIGFVFIPGFADWEFGLLSASAVEWFGAEAIALSPAAQPVRSIAGFRLTPDRSADADAVDDLDAIAVIGSDSWATPQAPDVSDLLKAVSARNGVVGGICAGTLALARAGLFADAAHTSNGRSWILQHEPAYRGQENYRDVPHAIVDGKLVSAPGSAPGTFAIEFLSALYPDKQNEIGHMRTIFAKEHLTAS